MIFLEKLTQSIKTSGSLLSVGLDPDFERLPESLRSAHNPLFEFNKSIVDRTHDLVCAYKLQIAGYAALGIQGAEILKMTINYLANNYPTIPIILDAKRGDIADTSENYAKEAFDIFEADGVTVNPYLGKDALIPFLERRDKGVIVLCKTSNPDSKDFQDLSVDGQPLYIKIAKAVYSWHQEYNNCLLVVGATWPEQMKNIREATGDMFFLVPGIGTQGGDLKSTLKNGLREDGSGLIIHSSRGIIYASGESDFADKARLEATKLRDQINLER